MPTNEIATVEELRKRLAAIFNKVEAGNLDVRQADALANLGGKMLKSVVVQLEYAELRGDKPDIPFLNAAATVK